MNVGRPLGLAATVLLTLAVGCFTPPTVMEATARALPLDEFPPGAEPVDIEVEPGTRLRGVFIPADPGAPVVVHFLGSTVTVAVGTRGVGAMPILWELHDRGFASLVLDYRGVGLSDGRRDPYHLREDARAIWEEALRRADCDPSRIVLRGISIGSLATGALLEERATPAGVVLAAPVRAETVAPNFAREELGRFLTALIGWTLRDSGDVDLVRAIATQRAPLFVHLGGNDELLPEKERRLLERAVAHAGGWIELDPDAGHVTTALRGHELTAEEATFLAELFPDIPDRETRLEPVRSLLGSGESLSAEGIAFACRRSVDPELALLVSRGRGPEPGDARMERLWLEWWRSLPAEFHEGSDSPTRRLVADLSDPVAPIDPRELVSLGRVVRGIQRERGVEATPESIAEHLLDRGYDRGSFYRAGDDGLFRLEAFVSAGQEHWPLEAPIRLLLPREESYRLAVRTALKGVGIVERARSANGRVQVEVREEGVWRTVELPALGPALPERPLTDDPSVNAAERTGSR